MFGYSRQAARKSAVFEMMFWFASRMTSLDLGLLCLRYHATWQARSYGPGGQRLGLWPSLPGVQHLVLVLGEALDQLPLELDARSDDRAVVLEIALAHAHAARRGIQRARRLVDHPHAMAAEARVVEGDTVERAYAAQHQVAEGTRDELAVGLEQDDLDGRIAQPHVFCGGRPAPPAADDDDPARRLGSEVTLHRGGAPTAQHADTQSDSRRSQELTPPHRLHPLSSPH